MRTGKLSCTVALAAAIFLVGSARAEQTQPAAVPAQDSTPPLKPGANSFAQSQARALLESRGYADVSLLVNNSDGIWRGTATRDNKPVSVSVDYQGHVSER
jgi:hypothetical protein